MLAKKNNFDLLVRILSILLSNGMVVYGVLYLNWNFFMVIYSYWFAELVSSVFDKIKYRTLKKRNELSGLVLGKESDGKFLFLFVYWIFIVLIAGFLAAPENTIGENIVVLLFMKRAFNISLLIMIIGELLVYCQQFILSRHYTAEEVIKANSLTNKRTMIMHIAIIAGAFIWFAMHVDHFFIHINPGKYGDSIFMIIFVGIRIMGEVLGSVK